MSDYKQTGDLIRREDAIHILACVLYAEASLRGEDAKMEDYIPEATAWMSDAPSADRPTGEWINTTSGEHYKCSVCGCMASYWFDAENSIEYYNYLDMSEWLSDFCPSCGAKMEGGEEE